MLCIFVTFLLGSQITLAEAPVYDVEVVIFSNQNSGDGGERWPTPVPDEFNVQDYSGGDRIVQLPESSYRLKGVSYSLRHSRGYSVLFHAAWRQPAYDNRNAIAYPIDTGIRNGASHLTGQIKLVRERYLHLDVDLLLTPANGSPLYELREKRRIRKSGTVHYFDHPRFGMIATLTRYVSPEAEQQLEDEAELEAAVENEESEVAAEPLPEDDQLTR